MTIEAYAPGRVNLIGDHTDYTGGLVLPLAVQLGVTITGEPTGTRVVLESDLEGEPALVPLDVADPAAIEPSWARYVAGVVAEVRPAHGFIGAVRSTVPMGMGLSSSAALEVAVALALGARGTAAEIATLCQRAEQRASGVPCGVMDQLTSLAGVEGHATLIDCTNLTVTPVELPESAEVVVVDPGEPRTLAGSGYAERRAQCEAAEAVVGSLARASLDDLERLDDPVLRRRARHVITENARVLECVRALGAGDLAEAGRLMLASHDSLRDDFEVSTPGLDETVAGLAGRKGVYGARLTGGGFGGSVVVLAAPGAVRHGTVVRPSGGARVRTLR
ncbi:MAG: galactokinase [Acidimicrobiales bacterium]|nr:galactokinase [Acidimicrobiales bacterium]MCB9371994.1 galactokinase [Microthrixaceae bacterium]